MPGGPQFTGRTERGLQHAETAGPQSGCRSGNARALASPPATCPCGSHAAGRGDGSSPGRHYSTALLSPTPPPQPALGPSCNMGARGWGGPAGRGKSGAARDPEPRARAPGEPRACPVPSPARPASGPESHEGHVLARRIPLRPPCPQPRCQLRQKAHPQVGSEAALAGPQAQMTGCGPAQTCLLRDVGARGRAYRNRPGPPGPSGPSRACPGPSTAGTRSQEALGSPQPRKSARLPGAGPRPGAASL